MTSLGNPREKSSPSGQDGAPAARDMHLTPGKTAQDFDIAAALEQIRKLADELHDSISDAENPGSQGDASAVREMESLARCLAFQAGEFILFPKLPQEIREMIWSYALPEGRLVKIDWPPDYRASTLWENGETELRVRTYIPALMKTCYEARQVALKRYSFRLQPETQRRHQWIDPVEDILYLQPKFDYESHSRDRKYQISQFADMLFHGDLEQIRHIAVDYEIASAFRERQFECLKKFPALEDISVIVPPFPKGYGVEIVILEEDDLEEMQHPWVQRIKNRWAMNFSDPNSPKLYIRSFGGLKNPQLDF